MAFVWGIGASWWFGLIAGVLLWWMNMRHPHPFSARRILRMIVPSLVVIWLSMMGIVAVVHGIAGLIPEKQRGVRFEAEATGKAEFSAGHNICFYNVAIP